MALHRKIEKALSEATHPLMIASERPEQVEVAVTYGSSDEDVVLSTLANNDIEVRGIVDNGDTITIDVDDAMAAEEVITGAGYKVVHEGME